MTEDTPGRFTITDGRCSFQIHKLIDGSMRREQYPDGIILSEDDARKYADAIWTALNDGEVQP